MAWSWCRRPIVSIDSGRAGSPLTLTPGAPIGRALAQAADPDGFAAHPARRVGAVIDVERLLEIAGAARLVDEIPQRRAALLQRRGQHRLDGGRETAIAIQRNPSGGALRSDARPKQRLAGVDVADAHHDMAVHDECFDRRRAATGTLVQQPAIETLFQRLDAQRGDQGMQVGSVPGPEQAAETAWIVEAKAKAIRQSQIVVVVLAGRAGGLGNAQAPGHAEMQDQVAGVRTGMPPFFQLTRVGRELDARLTALPGRRAPQAYQDVLPAPTQCLNPAAFELIRQGDRNRPAQPPVAHDHPLDGFPLKMRTYAPQRGFDFGQFRHAGKKRMIGISMGAAAHWDKRMPSWWGRVNEQESVISKRFFLSWTRKMRRREHIKCVVSVSMLTEGWDANTVTHIMGVRALGTQFHCEQVIGRGLRRMSYEAEARTVTKAYGEVCAFEAFPFEYAEVYGVPFDFIPTAGRPGNRLRPQRGGPRGGEDRIPQAERLPLRNRGRAADRKIHRK